jgi:hypothetical protein
LLNVNTSINVNFDPLPRVEKNNDNLEENITNYSEERVNKLTGEKVNMLFGGKVN